MKKSINPAVEMISKGPEFYLHSFSFLKVALIIIFSLLIYYLLKKLTQLFVNTGVLGKTHIYYKTSNIFILIISVLIFLIGLTNISGESLLFSLFFFVTLAIIVGFSLVDLARSFWASIILGMRENLTVGDYLTVKNFEGEVISIDTFFITVLSDQEVKIYIPTHMILKNTYQIHPKKAGPSITLTVPCNKISRQNLLRLTYLCPFRKKESQVKITTTEKNHELFMEVINQDYQVQIEEYFKKHYQ